MSLSRCTLCFQPSVQFPQDFKAVLSDFIQVFNKFQQCTRTRCGTGSSDCSDVTDLLLCRSCWVYFMRIHKLHGQLSVKKETCYVRSRLLSLKIRHGQRSLERSRNNSNTFEDFDVQILAEGNNVLEVVGQTPDTSSAIIGWRSCSESESGSFDLSATDDSASSESSVEGEPEELESESDSAPQPVQNDTAQHATVYENKWLPNDFTLSKSSSVVKRLSEVDFIYVDKYPFQGTENGFQCGLCSKVCTFYKKSPIWDNINNHMRKLHMGNRSAGGNQARRKSKHIGPRGLSKGNSEQNDSDVKGTSEDLDSAVVDGTASSVTVSASSGERQPVRGGSTDASDCESQEPHPSASVTTFENKWLPFNLTRLQYSPDIKRISEVDFVYLDKYPFQGTETGFKCGLCPSKSSFYKQLPLWNNMIDHIKRWHRGKGKQRVRANKILQRFIEVAPNRFQYGKYFVDKIGESYRCEECGVTKPAGTQNKASYIMVHITEKHENPPRTYVCEYCGIVFYNRNGLRVHKMNKHENPNDQFPCRDCGKIFGSTERVNIHQKRVHRKQHKFICESCGKEFSAKVTMEKHIACVHKKEKIKCEECGKMFGSQAALYTHRHSHTGKKFTCDICGMEFTQHYSVTRHKKTAHPE